MKVLLSLFLSFFKIGLFTFGGGYAMIPIIEREIIDKRGWIEKKDFLELLTLAQSAPGPIALNSSVFVGYKIRGYAGATAAILGVIIPSFVIILIVATCFADIRTNPVVDAAFKGMRPAVVALIIAPIAGLVKGMTWWMLALAAVIAMVVWYLGFSPIYLLLASAAAGIIYTVITTRFVKRNKK